MSFLILCILIIDFLLLILVYQLYHLLISNQQLLYIHLIQPFFVLMVI